MKFILKKRKGWRKEKKEKRGQAGFTLWELLLVIFLLGVTFTMAATHFELSADQARLQVDQANRERIEGAAQLYRIDVGVYPASVADLVCVPGGVSGWRGPYLNEVPQNPFDPAQEYRLNTLGQVK